MMSFSLQQQVAVVTGACGQLGSYWCQVLLEAGAQVAALDLPQAQPTALFLALQQQYPEKLQRFSASVSDKAQLEKACCDIVAAMGAVHILVNNAGIDQPPLRASEVPRFSALEDVSAEQFMGVLTVNTAGAFYAMQVFGAQMKACGGGSIINIGSLYATVAPDMRLYEHIEADPPFLKPPAYGASKAALHNLTRYFASHWGPYQVRVNTLSPGGVLGGQDDTFKAKFVAKTPLGRLAGLEDLAGPLLFLASPASAYVTGQNLQVDGGFTLW